MPVYPGAPSVPLLRHVKRVHLNFEKMIDADAVDAVGLRHGSALRFGVYDYAVDDEIDLVGADADFEGVGGFPVGVRFLHGVVGRLWRYGGAGVAGAAFDQPHPVLRDHKVQIALLRTFESAAAKHKAEEHTSELQSRQYLVCRLLLEKKHNILIVFGRTSGAGDFVDTRWPLLLL